MALKVQSMYSLIKHTIALCQLNRQRIRPQSGCEVAFFGAEVHSCWSSSSPTVLNYKRNGQQTNYLTSDLLKRDTCKYIGGLLENNSIDF